MTRSPGCTVMGHSSPPPTVAFGTRAPLESVEPREQLAFGLRFHYFIMIGGWSPSGRGSIVGPPDAFQLYRPIILQRGDELLLKSLLELTPVRRNYAYKAMPTLVMIGSYCLAPSRKCNLLSSTRSPDGAIHSVRREQPETLVATPFFFPTPTPTACLPARFYLLLLLHARRSNAMLVSPSFIGLRE